MIEGKFLDITVMTVKTPGASGPGEFVEFITDALSYRK